MPITTKTGDNGYSHWQGKKVAKNSPLLQCVGSLDELQSFLGLLKVKLPDYQQVLNQIQLDLWGISGELAYQIPYSSIETSISLIERKIKQFEDNLPVLSKFITPGKNEAEAISHICRTIARRSERDLITLENNQLINKGFLIYLNRLSDFLFLLARTQN